MIELNDGSKFYDLFSLCNSIHLIFLKKPNHFETTIKENLRLRNFMLSQYSVKILLVYIYKITKLTSCEKTLF